MTPAARPRGIPPLSTGWAKKNGLVLGLLLLATASVYLNGLGNPFTLDDRSIIFRNFQTSEGWRLADLFGRGLFAREAGESTYFRPLTLLTFAVNHWLAGQRPAGYRAVNIAIHLVVVLLTLRLLSGIATPWVAVFSTLLFALHPVHVQAVTYISSRSDLLYTALGLLALILWHKANRTQGGSRRLLRALALGSFFVGLFAKETMIVFPVLTALMDVTCAQTGSWRQQVKGNLPWYLGFFLAFSLYFSIRLAEGFVITTEGDWEAATGIAAALKSNLLFAANLLWLYLGLSFYPARLHFFRAVPAPEGPLEWPVIQGLTLLAALILLSWISWRAHREVTLGILWFLISLFPVLNLIPLNAPMMEHWLYLPLIGLALAFVGGLRIVAERVGETRGAAIGLILLAVLLSAKTVARNAEWKDLARVFSQDVAAFPTSGRAWIWLADALKHQQRWSEAVDAYKTALSLNPHPQALVGLADALAAMGKDKEGEDLLLRVIAITPRDPWLFHILALHRLKMGKNSEALEAIEKNIALAPTADAYHVSGSIHLMLGQKEKAEQAFRQALLLGPKNPRFHGAIHVRLGKLHRLQGRLEEARVEGRIALRFDPGNSEARGLLEADKGK